MTLSDSASRLTEALQDVALAENWPGNLTIRQWGQRWQQHNAHCGTAQQVLNPVELTKDTFDIVDLVVSPNEDFLIFRTRQNSILWATRIPEGLQPNSS